MKNRYYVQPLTEQVYLIRERLSASGGPGPNDPIVRSFSVRHDAYMYVNSINAGAVEPPVRNDKHRPA
ncbi:hypothetical protein [Dictyobacter aurantiacus]|uniref:Uncharacterized protein n=1 Tax=Dictyobacter aurantiacus TaxID=1936993 RepID=A0A401Z9V4_9CHLR|nr:hypothetical protein [Dictyobacter aurantiacus]GCE03660.1 hypothetical protein KDAU_09890 [Dictyobacter aurantiacus]